jgi:hypothetical protein
MHMGSPSPLERERGKGEGFRVSEYASFQTPHLNPLPYSRGEAGSCRSKKTECGFVGMGAGFIKVPEMDLIAFC